MDHHSTDELVPEGGLRAVFRTTGPHLVVSCPWTTRSSCWDDGDLSTSIYPSCSVEWTRTSYHIISYHITQKHLLGDSLALFHPKTVSDRLRPSHLKEARILRGLFRQPQEVAFCGRTVTTRAGGKLLFCSR